MRTKTETEPKLRLGATTGSPSNEFVRPSDKLLPLVTDQVFILPLGHSL